MTVLHPRYLTKGGRQAALFAFLSAGVGVTTDPKLFRLVAAFVKTHRMSTSWLAICAAVAFCASFLLLQTVLDPRYVTRQQSSAAAFLFLLIFAAGYLAGFTARLLALEPAPSVVTTDDLLTATVVLSLGGAVAATLYNAVFVQKTDYTKLRSELKSLLSTIDTLTQTYRRDGYLTPADADSLKSACVAAHTAATEVAKLEVPSYGRLVVSCYVEPLNALMNAAAAEGVHEVPESFLAACGLLDEKPEHELAFALRSLQNEG